jgi:integrase
MKPAKPYAEFPLYPHGNGQWAAKVSGKREYFGPWAADRDGKLALERYTAKITPGARSAKTCPLFEHSSGQWAKKIDGQTVYFGTDKAEALRKFKSHDTQADTQVQAGGMTLLELVNRFLTTKQMLVGRGELKQGTFDDYMEVTDMLIEQFGENWAVVSIGPIEFEDLLRTYTGSGRKGLVSIADFIIRVRAVFNYGQRNGLFERPVTYGDAFRKPSKARMRIERQGKPKKLFERREIRALLKAASPQVRAMILLAINCGFNNHDCAALEEKFIDLDGQWIDYPRPKTGVHRRAPLWKATVKAIREALKSRPKPKNEAHKDRVFITRVGDSWEAKSAITGEFAKLIKKLGLRDRALKNNRRLCFGALRHTFQTIGNRARDKDATRTIMAHSPLVGDMSAEYTEELPDDARLRRVANHVWKWLRKSQSRQEASSAAVEHRS